MEKTEYKRLFPHDVYAESELEENWSTGPPIVNTSITVDSAIKWNVPGLQAAPPGRYRLTFTLPTDSISITRDFVLSNPYQRLSPVPTWLEAKIETNYAQPGDTRTLTLQTPNEKCGCV